MKYFLQFFIINYFVFSSLYSFANNENKTDERGYISTIKIELGEQNPAYAMGYYIGECLEGSVWIKDRNDFDNIEFGVQENTKQSFDLLRFDASCNKTEEVVKLVWETMNEINLDSYILEKRSEESANFEEIIRIVAKGKPAQNIYSLKDPNVEKGTRYYYRLRSVDKEGTINKDIIEEVMVPGDKFIVKSYPNPVIDKLFVIISGKRSENIQIELMDNIGRRKQQIVELKDTNKTYEKVSLDMSNLPQGQYYIKVISGQRVEIQKVVHIN